MTTTINASPSNGIVQTADGSGVMKLQSNGVTTNALAWVNFNGASGAIRASYNVSSVTRNSAGNYTVTFTNTLSDANYSTSWAVSANAGNAFGGYESSSTARTTSAVTVLSINTSTAAAGDCSLGSVAIFGN